MKEIKLGNKKISENSPIFFIGEIGINHNGSVDIAKQIIDLAKICNIDAVKFQKRTPEICVPDNVKNRIKETPWGEMTYLEYKKRIEFGYKEYKNIDKYCKEKNIIWFASPWDVPSVDFLEKFDVPCYKIASALLTDEELLEKIKSLNKPVFLSTGMSTEEEIKKAVEFLGEKDLVIMHCNSSYPAKNGELNLKYITKLKEKFPDAIIGYSGHEEGIAASLVAANLGATVIERHITIDRAMWGTDQAASIEFSGLRRLTRDLKKLPIWLGDGNKKVYDSEKKIKEKLRRNQ
ncbi:MAG: N-acetylneuraminate synthase family protein [Candidatus Thermoplasmatota archaeon]|nr:N-acetylneuraminate synthase family protein [Candidatus Thermoplasmatota archaeon]